MLNDAYVWRSALEDEQGRQDAERFMVGPHSIQHGTPSQSHVETMQIDSLQKTINSEYVAIVADAAKWWSSRNDWTLHTVSLY